MHARATVPAPASLGYRPALDGVRAIAILMVLAYHEGALRGGFLGVDLFFVLSGFLITSILMQEWNTTRSLLLGKFYLRRILRLAPALCAFVLTVYAVARWWEPSLSSQIRGRWALAALLYVSNLLIAYGREYPLGYVSICWSLAIEEQFYLLWPLTLRAWLRRGLSRGAFVGLLLGAIAASTALRPFLLARGGQDPDVWLRIYFAPDTRADALLWGCLLGLALGWWRLAASLAGLSIGGAILGFGTLAFMAVTCDIADLVARPWLFTCSSVASGLLLAEVVRGGALARTLAWRPLVWVGQLSYSLYLWHAVGFTIGSPGGLVGRWAAPLALAALSHYLIERPFLRLKDHFAPIVVSDRWLAFRRRSHAPTPNPWSRLAPVAGAAALFACVGLGLASSARVQPRLALDQARRELAAHPGDARLLVQLGQAQAAEGQWNEAIRTYEQALARLPADPQVLTGLGMALLGSGRPGAAQPLFDEALRARPDHADAYRGRGAVALEQGRATDAIAAYQEALRLAPNDPRVHNELGIAYASIGEIEKAVGCFKVAVRLDPNPALVANLTRAQADLAERRRR